MTDQQRIRGVPGQTYEDRFSRYAHNASITAGIANGYAAAMRRAASLHRAAAVNAHNHDDQEGADLYDEMAKATEDAEDALKDVAALARQVARHYGGHPEQGN